MKKLLVLLTSVAASTSIFGQQPSTEPLTTGVDAVTPKLIANPPIGKVAFVCQSMLGKNPFLYVLNHKGTLARISKGSSPDFSSDGKKLIYSNVDGGITTRDLMTNASAPLITGVFAGRLSPNSKRLLSASFNHLTQNSLLEIVDIKTGTKTTLLSEEGGGLLSSPAWSPNGNEILFTSGRGMLVPFSEGFQIWSMNADGKSSVNMSNNGEGCNNAVWSPDGSRVAWTAKPLN